MSDPTSDPARIERELDKTRSRLGDHLNELQDRLSPGQVLDDLMGYFRGSDGAEIGRNLLDNVRGNPMPAALTGIGLAWLMASTPQARGPVAARKEWQRSGTAGSHLYGSEDYDATMLRVRNAEQGVSRNADEPEHDYSARVDDARGKAIGLARHTDESADSFAGRVKAALAASQDAITNVASGMRDKMGGAAASASDAISSMAANTQNSAHEALQSASDSLSQKTRAAGQASTNLVNALTESPVLLGALGLAAGALLGALLPQSDQEETALGGIAGQVRGVATDLAQAGMQRGKAVTSAVADQLLESADNHGFTGDKTPGQMVDAALSGDLADNAKSVAHEVLQTGDKAIREQVEASSRSSTAPSSSASSPKH